MFLHCTFYKCLELLFASEFSTRKIYRYFCSDDSCPFFIIPLSTLEVNDFQPMGITPAYAGKRSALLAHISGHEDHPRLCGEKSDAISPRYGTLGSPPPMRGKVLGLRTSGLLPRITPAYAGKSHSKRTREKINGDHPRLCGEKAVVGNYNRIFVGSPPPMRGKVREFLFFRFIFGITPAYAGKSLFL